MKILGHRGCILQNKPFQNSVEAFKLALQHTQGFETDACLSADGDIFFIHEEVQSIDDKVTSSLPLYLDEASTQKLNGHILKDIPTAEVKTFKLKDGQGIPTFEDIAPLFKNQPNKIWNIELKGHQVTPHIIQKLQKAFAEGRLIEKQIILSSFDHLALKDVRINLPHVKIGALFIAEFDDLKPLNPWRKDDEGFYMPMTEKNISRPLIQELNPEYIIAPHTELNEKQINRIQIHHKTAQFVIWVCGEYNNFDQADFNKKVRYFSLKNQLSCIIVDDIIQWKTL